MNNGFSARFKYYVAASLLLALASTTNVSAQAQSPATEQDPRALKALQDMGSFLRTLKHLHLIASTETDQVLEDGQSIQFSSNTEMIAIQPNKLRVSVVDRTQHKVLYYNGKRFALFDKSQDYYASGDAPSTIDGLLDDMSSRYGVVLPLADLFRWSDSTAQNVGITSALYIDNQEIGGRLCAHYAYRQPDVDWQIWIHLGARPLPCQLVIVRQDNDAKPRHRVRYQWIEGQPASNDSFDFVPPPGVRSVPLKQISPSNREEQP